MIHQLSDVQSEKIGKNTFIWQFSIVLAGATIGENCNINCHTFIENNVTIGDFVTIKSGVYLWDGLQIEDYVFVGPNVSFTNDVRPRSKLYPETFNKTLIKKNASIGAGAIILGGIIIGEFAMVAAGALVTKSVPARALVLGTPAKVIGWLNDDGTKMEVKENHFVDKSGDSWFLEN
jgi:acetyltransferase-like isoleucine patch superfamily enzyme